MNKQLIIVTIVIVLVVLVIGFAVVKYRHRSGQKGQLWSGEQREGMINHLVGLNVLACNNEAYNVCAGAVVSLEKNYVYVDALKKVTSMSKIDLQSLLTLSMTKACKNECKTVKTCPWTF